MALQLHPDKCRAPHSTEAFKGEVIWFNYANINKFGAGRISRAVSLRASPFFKS